MLYIRFLCANKSFLLTDRLTYLRRADRQTDRETDGQSAIVSAASKWCCTPWRHERRRQCVL